MVTKKKYITIFLIIALVIVFAFHIHHVYRYTQNQKAIPSVDRGCMAVFHQEMNDSVEVTKIDATEHNIYIAYGNVGVIAVYDRNGMYQYSLAFFNDTNGGLSMRCDHGLLYVSDFAGYELVMDEQELVSTFSPSELMHELYWFDQSEPTVYCTDGKIFDNNGVFIMDLP